MSYTTITQCTRDAAFQDRVQAAAMKEAIASETYSNTTFGAALRAEPRLAIEQFIWPLSVDNEEAYEYAVDTGTTNPGGDLGVITDAAIQAGIQAHWPPESEPVL